jgi:hypothetical protein
LSSLEEVPADLGMHQFRNQETYSGILLLDRLVEKSPYAMLICSGDFSGPCYPERIPLIFFEEIETTGFQYKKLYYRYFFPFFVLVEDHAWGCNCLNFFEGKT